MFLIDIGIKDMVSMEDKIKYIKYKNINIYNTSFIDIKYAMPNSDIKKDIKYIENILNSDYIKQYQPSIDNLRIIKVYGSEWLCDNGRLIKEPDVVFNIWLDKYSEINKLYYKYTKDMTSGKAYSNFIRMKTYIIKTEYIIDTILEYIRSKDRDL